jgi:ribonuclease Y
MEIVIASFAGLFLGGIIVFMVKKIQDESSKKSAKVEAEKIVQRAKSEAAKIDKDSKARAKDFEARARKNVEAEILKQKNKLKSQEGQLEKKLKDLDDNFKGKLEDLDKDKNLLKTREEKIVIAENRLREMERKHESEVADFQNKLANVAQMSVDEARRELREALQDEVKQECAKTVFEIEQRAEQEAAQKVKRIYAQSLSRFAGEYTSERTVSVLALPTEEMKGKIIGREGRNIRTLEALCGVDLIVDDTPEAVVISGFDPIRRELARRTLEKLMEDGRVHPARIEEVVEKMKTELNKSIKDEGDKVCLELGVTNLHPEIVKILGGLKYRHSHTQNLLNHSMEVAYISGLIAAELGANVKMARRAGLLHDIGKGIDHSFEGSHAFVGAEFAKKFGEGELVCHAIRAHHDEEKPTSVIAHIVQAANLLSNTRPGARRPGMDNFIHRLNELESIGNSFEGVLKTFAVQAGREVRVIVEASKVTDEQSVMLSRDIVRKVERELPHLGQIRIQVLRETRSVEHAR